MSKRAYTKLFRLFTIITIAIVISGCGGSDSEAPSSGRDELPSPTLAPPIIGSATPIIENNDFALYGQSSAVLGESVGLALIPKNANARVQWQQISGPEVSPLATNSFTIGFDVPSAGEYQFMAQITQGDGTTTEMMHDLSVSDSDETVVNVRLDHNVSELGKVSLYLDTSSPKQISEINWTQLSGPQISEVTEQLELNEQGGGLFFDAPAVDEHQLIEMEARVVFSDGTEATDQTLVTVTNVEFDTDGLFYSNNFVISEDMHAYNAQSPYKQAIERCVYNNQIPSRPDCTFSQLPLIGSVRPNPSVQDILDRTLVSHQWMGDNFKHYLESSAAGADMLQLLRGVTAIVISYDVRPSFYWVATGAIYLDARNFWQTPSERDTLNDQADFRSGFGSELNFSVFWRYTKNNEYYPANTYTKAERESRRFADLEASISWLMYHELAHANDFFPSTTWQNVSSTTSPLDYFQNNAPNSDSLDRQFPLRSDEMHALAQVSFAGESATSQQRNYRGTDIEGFFVPDIASSYYSYLTTREDFATLAERFMMLYRFGAEADIAIIEGQTADDFNVVWGQRNRISEQALRDRTAFVVSRVYPELGSESNIAQLQAELAPPRLMDPNKGWFENIDLSPGTESADLNEQGANQHNTLTKAQRLLRAQSDQRRAHEGAPLN